MKRPRLIQRLVLSSKGKVEPDFMKKGFEFNDQLIASSKRLAELIRTEESVTNVAHLDIVGSNGQTEKFPVFYSCRTEDEEDVKRMLAIYADETRNDHKLEAPIAFGDSILNYARTNVCGWHCFDSDFIFFSNLKAYIIYLEQLNQL